jgi:tetratricopeptide (TPR) repeat protein
MSFLARLVQQLRGASTDPAGTVEVRLAPLAGDSDGAHTRHLATALGDRRGIRCRTLPQPLPMDLGDNEEAVPARLAGTLALARHWLAEEKAQILVWGAAPAPAAALDLHLAPAGRDEADRPGGFGGYAHLVLPADFNENYAAFLHAVILAAVPAKGEAQARRAVGQVLLALEAARRAEHAPPTALTDAEQATIQACFAGLATLAGAQSASLDWLHTAEETYLAALASLSRRREPADWAAAQRGLGAVLQTLAETAEGDATTRLLGRAAEALRAALQFFDRTHFPFEWASTQRRLGEVLYRLDAAGGDANLLKDSIAALQAALQVFTRAEFPQRWADLMNSFAQAAQVLGEYLHSRELLEKAVHACQAALEIRTRETAPLLWAASQNNLGSALFLLGRETGQAETLAAAERAFGGALEVYRGHGATRLATVAEKNMAHLERYRRARGGRPVAAMPWETEGKEAADAPDPDNRRPD